MFDFNTSHNNVAPVSPMLFPVDFMKLEKSGLLMDVICVLFLLNSLPRLSSVSVVFDFSASLNDVAPLSPILLSVYSKRMEKRVIVDGSQWCVVSFVFTMQIEFHEDRI